MKLFFHALAIASAVWGAACDYVFGDGPDACSP